jgi:transcriptional regulator with XRE-family HTH domain
MYRIVDANSRWEGNEMAPSTPGEVNKPESEPIDLVVYGIGPKVRQLRRQKSLSLQQLAERPGVSAAAIHKIERNGMVPTIATLMKLATALNRSVGFFVDEDSSPCSTLVRPGERKRVFTSKLGLRLDGISGPYGPFFIAGAMATMDAGADIGPRPMEHPGEELFLLLEGRVDFEVDGDGFELEPGDAVHFRTDRPHRWRNPGEEPARGVWLDLRAP